MVRSFGFDVMGFGPAIKSKAKPSACESDAARIKK
jgi:hypothetical protein